MKKILKKLDLCLLLILSLAVFFRFYNFRELQYWSLDEELLTATIRHIVWDRSPTLLVQNVAISFGLGPYYHYLLVPFFYVSNFNLVLLGSLSSQLGVLTTYFVFLSGKIIGGKKLGYLAAFLYASSFFIAIFDRRLVHLTLDSFMCSLALFGVLKVIKNESKYLMLLAIPAGFALHADPSIAVLVISILASIIFFRVKLKSRYTAFAALIFFIFLLPFIGAEIFYNGAVSRPLLNSFSKPLHGSSISPVTFVYYDSKSFLDVLGRVIAVAPSDFIEKNFEYAKTYEKPLFSPFTQTAAVLLMFSYLHAIFKSKNDERKYDLVVLIFFASFVLGIIVFNAIFKGAFYQHYFVIIFPILVIMFAKAMMTIAGRRNLILVIFAVLFVFVNLFSMLNSQVKYPLYRKIELVNKIAEKLRGDQFSIEATGDTWVQSGGWTELFTLKKNFAVKSFSYAYLDWIYRSYSLYPGATQDTDPGKIVLFKLANEKGLDLLVISENGYKDIRAIIYDNSKNAGAI